MNRLKSHLHFLQLVKDIRLQARLALLVSADDELIKAIVQVCYKYAKWEQ